jgi:hypothetical protein
MHILQTSFSKQPKANDSMLKSYLQYILYLPPPPPVPLSSRYTHKTSSYITSSYKTSVSQTSSYRMSRLQNVQVTKRPFYKTSRLQNVLDTKRPVFVNFKTCLKKTFSQKSQKLHTLCGPCIETREERSRG